MNANFQCNLSGLLCAQGLTTAALQHQFLSQITGEPLSTIAGWGANLEFIPPFYQGIAIGYIAGINAAQATIDEAQNQANAEINAMAWQNYHHNQTIAQMGQILTMRY
jgi:hypothetical protein